MPEPINIVTIMHQVHEIVAFIDKKGINRTRLSLDFSDGEESEEIKVFWVKCLIGKKTQKEIKKYQEEQKKKNRAKSRRL